jgi:hypothetical protein
MRKIAAITRTFILLNSKRGVILLNRLKDYSFMYLVDGNGDNLIDNQGRNLITGLAAGQKFLFDGHGRLLVDSNGRALVTSI